MANTVTHTFLSAKADGADATKIRASNWNAEHTFAGGALGSLLYRDTVPTDGANWLAAVATGSVLISGGVGVVPAWSATPTLTSLTANVLAIAATSTDGLIAQNPTAATAGVPVQMSPRVRLHANVWNTTAVAATNTQDWIMEILPTSSTTPGGSWKLGVSMNGGAYTFPLTVNNNGGVTASSAFAAPTIGVGGSGSGNALVTGPGNGQLNINNNSITTGVGIDVATDAVFKVRTRAQTGYATVDCLGLKASGAAGASFGPGAVASITVVNGIVTACS